MIYNILLLFCALFTGHPPVYADIEEDRYALCLDMTRVTPDKAINEALIWQNEQGGIPARHCEAVGLFYMGEYAEAAARLDLIAEDMRTGKDMPIRMGSRMVATGPMMADMYGQAANAWLMAKELVQADSDIDLALSLAKAGSPQELELMLDRARIAAADNDYEMALADLEHIQQKDPGRKDILVLIASSARSIHRYAVAEPAIEEYISLYPDDPAGHLERGNLFDATDRPEEARRSWLQVLQLTEEGLDAQAARANLERLDVRKPEIPEPLAEIPVKN